MASTGIPKILTGTVGTNTILAMKLFYLSVAAVCGTGMIFYNNNNNNIVRGRQVDVTADRQVVAPSFLRNCTLSGKVDKGQTGREE